jgi:hypothetical protein
MTSDNHRNWFRILSGRKACTVSISIVLFLLLVFGLVPQDGGGNGFLGALGFRSMKNSPVFIAALLFLTLCLTLNAVEDIRHFSGHRLGVTCAHLGLSVILIAGIFGGGTALRTVMTAEFGVPSHSGLEEISGTPVKYPFELTLKGFNADEYSAALTLTLPGGESSDVSIKVNHPAKVRSWWIYLSDCSMNPEPGTFSCTFRCVRSPLSGVFRAALWLLLVSAAAMAFFAGFRPAFTGKEVHQ